MHLSYLHIRLHNNNNNKALKKTAKFDYNKGHVRCFSIVLSILKAWQIHQMSYDFLSFHTETHIEHFFCSFLIPVITGITLTSPLLCSPLYKQVDS